MITLYPTKKVLKEQIGKRISYMETSMCGKEYKSTGTIFVSNYPHISGMGHEYHAKILMKDDILMGVK